MTHGTSTEMALALELLVRMGCTREETQKVIHNLALELGALVHERSQTAPITNSISVTFADGTHIRQ